MTEDLVQVLKDSPSFPDLARFNFDKIVEIKRDVEKNFIDLAFLFVQSRDFRLWEFLDYESFEAFIADPMIKMKRSSVYDLMRIYDIFISKLKVSEDDLIIAGRANLLEAAKVLEKDSSDVVKWVNEAKELSKSDMKLEVSTALGKGHDINLSPPKPPLPSPGPSDSVCCACGNPNPQRAHFPTTKGAGTPDNWTIPLCGKCHIEDFHRDPKEWTWQNRRKWAAYLYGRIEQAEKRYAELVETVSQRTDQAK